MVGEGDGADPAPVRAVGAAGARRAGRDRGRARAGDARAGSTTPRRCSTPPATALDARRALPRRPTARYVWAVNGLEDLRLAPFHILAAESGAFAGRDHGWHLEHCDALVAADPDWIRRTDRRVVDVTDPASEAEATAWWEALTAAGGEGMVVKPIELHRPRRRASRASSAAAASTCGSSTAPSTTRPSQLDRLRSRALGRKRSLASREFALGVEALERFARREPLYRVHECVFAVLALESEPVDPRL